MLVSYGFEIVLIIGEFYFCCIVVLYIVIRGVFPWRSYDYMGDSIKNFENFLVFKSKNIYLYMYIALMQIANPPYLRAKCLIIIFFCIYGKVEGFFFPLKKYFNLAC